jgi:peptidyl-prolyl cis-trans isomerase C
MKELLKMNAQFIRVLLLQIIIIFTFVIGCEQKAQPVLSADKKVNLANTYYNNELFEAAIREYTEYITQYEMDDNRRANIYYTIANIYFDRLNDYNKALENYLRIKHLYPESKLQREVGKKIVNCLERLERAQDAQRILNKETALKPEEVSERRPGEVIAKIGDKTISQGDLDFEINQLPPYIQSQINTKEKKLEFLQQYIAEELLYDSAKRKGLEKDKDVIAAAFRAKKRLMAQKILSEELKDKINIQEADVELYYKANKDKYAEKDDSGKIIRQKSFQESAQQVAQDLYLERQEQAYRELIVRLNKAENVKIYDQKVQ